MKRMSLALLGAAVALVLGVGCPGETEETPTTPPVGDTPTEKPEVTPTEKPEVTPTQEPDVTPTQEPVVTPSPTPDAQTETPEPTPTDTPDSSPTATPLVDADGDGVGAGEDCNDLNDAIYPGAPELCDSEDNDCDLEVDESPVGGALYFLDLDGDTYGDASTDGVALCEAEVGYSTNALDCDDDRSDIHPGAVEACTATEDLNCDGVVGDKDTDGDSYVACVDCNDQNSAIHPNAQELCDSIDNDCDGKVDDDDTAVAGASAWYLDADGDTYGVTEKKLVLCNAEAPYSASRGGDCNDSEKAINPSAPEVCNTVDDDCDGGIDDADAQGAQGGSTWYKDGDGDGHADPADSQKRCQAGGGYSFASADDCNDDDGGIYPGATEDCDGKDDDCDSSIDEDIPTTTWYQDVDGDGYGTDAVTTQTCGKPVGFVALGTDCNDADAAVNPGAGEICNGVDDNCNSTADEGFATTTFYPDNDMDGYGDMNASTTQCVRPTGYIEQGGDCNDANALTHPTMPEACDGVDQDCDNIVDESATGCPGFKSLLISEISVAGDIQEFVEIYNPTIYTIDLTNYYLTDLSNWSTSSGKVDNAFINLVSGTAKSQVNDFLVRFPPGEVILPGEALVIVVHKSASDGSTMVLDPAIVPDFEIADTSAEIANMVIAGGTTVDKKNVGLSNANEFVLLLYWDGTSSLVQDVDYVRWYGGSGNPQAVDRTGVGVNGPSGLATYANDTAVGSQQLLPSHNPLQSLCRQDLLEGLELTSGGNGVGGADETSEDLPVTWDVCQTFTPGYL